MIKMQQHQIFVTSCYVTYLEPDNHNQLIENIRSIAMNTLSNSRSNQGGYQSYPYQNPKFDNPIIEKLFVNTIQPAAQEIMDSWGLHSIKMEKYCYWYNINHKYTYNSPHTHPESYVSGVYYVKVPKKSGNIVFDRSESERDRMSHQSSVIIQQGLKIDNSNINTEHWFTPKEGMLIMFPGHLTHYVQQNLTNEEDSDRISFSFNFF